MKILVIGDIMLDTYKICDLKTNGVYNVTATNYKLGGAANVAVNLKSLGCDVHMIGVRGNDLAGETIINLLNKLDIPNNILIIDDRLTSEKTRIVREVIELRFDSESLEDINDLIETQIINLVKSQEIKPDAIVLSDYNKGVLTDRLCKEIIVYCNTFKILSFVDPKFKNPTKFINCSVLKLNLNEGQIITSKKDMHDIFDELRKMGFENHIILTCAEKGMYLNSISHHVKGIRNEQYMDCTGCGDIVISAIALLYSMTNDISRACNVANFLASRSVSSLGNYVVTLKDVEEDFVDFLVYDYDEKQIKTMNRLYNDKTVVFTNGCFDIIHSTHIQLLNYCKQIGTVLIVGLNSDESIRSLKGESRPVNNLDERIKHLRYLGIIDHIIIFNDITPLKILSILKPEKMVKGGDYTAESIIGKEFAKQTICFSKIDGVSTTKIIEKIHQSPF